MRQPETVRDYLDTLRRAVAWRRGAREAAEVVADYRELLTVELDRGKAEVEICRTLEPPYKVARALAEEAHTRQSSSPVAVGTAVRLAVSGGLLLLLTAVLMRCLGDQSEAINAVPIRLDVLAALLCPLGMGLLWRDFLPRSPLRRSGALLCACHLVSFLAVVGMLTLVFWSTWAYMVPSSNLPLIWGSEPTYVGPTLARVLMGGLAVEVCAFGFAIWGVFRRNAWFLTAVAQGLGGMYTFLWLINIMMQLDDLESLLPNLIWCARPYLAGFVGALLLIPVLAWKGGGRRGRAA